MAEVLLDALQAAASDLPAQVAAALDEPAAGRELTVDAAGYRWQAIEWGDPADPPVLLVHGVTSNAETFWRVGPAVAAGGWHVVAVDLPGHGRTGGWRGRHRFAATPGAVGSRRRSRLPVCGRDSSSCSIRRRSPPSASRR